jgi:hypothetical protein
MESETPTVSGVGHHLTGDRHPGDTAGVLALPQEGCPARRREVLRLIPRPAGEVEYGRGREFRAPPGALAGDPSVTDKRT